MPKPMLNFTQTQTTENTILSTTQQSSKVEQKQLLNQHQMDRLLRNKRSKEYMEAIHKLDAGGHVTNHAQVQEIIDAIANEFPEVTLEGVLLGYVSICYLGAPYEVHTLDMSGQIIRHYKVGETLPNGLERARTLAIRGGYDFIEVYDNCCRCISHSGAVSVVNC